MSPSLFCLLPVHNGSRILGASTFGCSFDRRVSMHLSKERKKEPAVNYRPIVRSRQISGKRFVACHQIRNPSRSRPSCHLEPLQGSRGERSPGLAGSENRTSMTRGTVSPPEPTNERTRGRSLAGRVCVRITGCGVAYSRLLDRSSELYTFGISAESAESRVTATATHSGESYHNTSKVWS